MTGEAQVDATERGARHGRAALDDLAAVVALRRDGDAAEHGFVEGRQHSPVAGDDVHVSESGSGGSRCLAHGRIVAVADRGVTPRLSVLGRPSHVIQNGPMQTAAVILAAGASTRFGSPKQAARIGERTMLEAVVAVADAAGLHPVIAVVPSGVAVPRNVVPVINDDPGAGMSRSLRLGLAAVPPDADAAVILLGDQPTLDPSVIGRLLADEGARPVVAAHAEGRSVRPFSSVERHSGSPTRRRATRG